MQSNTMAIVSLVTGILSILFSCACGPLLSIAALITGFLGLKQAAMGAGGKGMAIGGMAMGGVSILIWIGMMIFMFIFGDMGMLAGL